MLKSLILASGSKNRRAVADQIPLAYFAIKPDVDERLVPYSESCILDDGYSYVSLLSEMKAKEVYERFIKASNLNPELLTSYLKGSSKGLTFTESMPDMLISADTMMWFEKRLLGKARSAEEAREVLTCIRGKIVRYITGVTVVDLLSGKIETRSAFAELFMSNYTDAMIERYLETTEPMNSAGSILASDRGSLMIQGIVGELYSHVGFPVHTIKEIFRFHGRDLFNYTLV